MVDWILLPPIMALTLYLFRYASEIFGSAHPMTGLSSRLSVLPSVISTKTLDWILSSPVMTRTIIIVFYGSGYGTFDVKAYIQLDGFHPRWVAVGDFNKDTWLDVVVANAGTNNVGVFSGQCSGTFSSQTTYFTELRSEPYSSCRCRF